MTPPAAAARAVRAPALVPGRPLRSAPGPRRVSGPSRKPAAAPQRAAVARDGLVLGVLAWVQRVSSHRMLDRLIRGRTWIALVAFALIGIVTLQLGLLKLNAGIGRSLERSALLQRQNAALSIENSELTAGNRVEATAEHLGMQLVAPADLHFLSATPGVDAAKAAAALAAPAPSSTASAEASASSAARPTGEASTAESSSRESHASSEAPSPTEASSSASQASSAPSGESAGAGASTPSASESPPAEAAPPTSAPATPAGPASEATPAGGTQAAPGG